jgi:hypothetical protein
VVIDVDSFFPFQLVFHNYSKNTGPSPASPATARSKRIADNILLDDSSCVNSELLELSELRQQLQAMKKQSLIVMDQSRKSSEREKIALQQAQEALVSKDSAISEALQATSREKYMLELLNDSSLDMVGKFFPLSPLLYPCTNFPILIIICDIGRPFLGCHCRRPAR